MTVPDGCFAQVATEDRPAALTACASSSRRRASAVGSGDAFLAGYVAARYSGAPAEECLRFGVACGAESTQHFGAGRARPARRRAAAREVEVERSSRRRAR